MAEENEAEKVERSEEERREADERREGAQVTTQKLFNDYGFEDERKSDKRRDDGTDRRDN